MSVDACVVVGFSEIGYLTKKKRLKITNSFILYMAEIILNTSKHNEIINVTEEIQEIITKSKIKEGICSVFTPHATGAVIINENYDKGLCNDIIKAMEMIVPAHEGWEHDKTDNNAAAHIKAAILGPSETVQIKDNKLQLGQWQDISFIELDGPRAQRKIIIELIKK